MKTAGEHAAASTYLPHVDGMRALAVVSVLIYHLYPPMLPGGFVGVDVFFVISGYVVTSSLAQHRSESLAAFLGRFYARRLARILPALVMVLTITTVAYVLLVPRAWFNRAADGVGQAAYWGFSNWVLDREAVNYFEPRAELNPYTHTWSLGVEEQFYLIAPLLLYHSLALNSSARRRRGALALLVALTASSFLACGYFSTLYGSRFAFYQITFRFWELGVGVLLFHFSGQKLGVTSSSMPSRMPTSLAGLLLIVVALAAPHPRAYPWIRSLCAVVGTTLLIGSPVDSPKDIVRKIFAYPHCVWLGLRSYSLYLWHWPVYVIFRWTVGLERWPFILIALCLSLVAAALSYTWVENPVRRSDRLKRLPTSVRIAALLALSLIGWQGNRLLIEAQPALGLGLPTRHAEDWYLGQQLMKHTYPSSRLCDPQVADGKLGNDEGSYTEYLPIGCATQAQARLFVIGDSHAMAYLPMLEQLSAEQGRTVTVLHPAGCAYLDLMRPMERSSDPKCVETARAAMRTVLEKSRPGDVVFLTSLRVPRLISLGGDRRRNSRGSFAEDHSIYERTSKELQSIEQASRDAPDWFVPFQKAGLHVIFEAPKPVFRAHPFYCVDVYNRNNPDCRGGLTESRADQEAYRAPILRTLADLAARYPGTAIWDPLPDLCDEARCNAMREGRPLFFDGDHVSPYGNVVLFPSFKRALQIQLTPIRK